MKYLAIIIIISVPILATYLLTYLIGAYRCLKDFCNAVRAGLEAQAEYDEYMEICDNDGENI